MHIPPRAPCVLSPLPCSHTVRVLSPGEIQVQGAASTDADWAAPSHAWHRVETRDDAERSVSPIRSSGLAEAHCMLYRGVGSRSPYRRTARSAMRMRSSVLRGTSAGKSSFCLCVSGPQSPPPEAATLPRGAAPCRLCRGDGAIPAPRDRSTSTAWPPRALHVVGLSPSPLIMTSWEGCRRCADGAAGCPRRRVPRGRDVVTYTLLVDGDAPAAPTAHRMLDSQLSPVNTPPLPQPLRRRSLVTPTIR